MSRRVRTLFSLTLLALTTGPALASIFDSWDNVATSPSGRYRHVTTISYLGGCEHEMFDGTKPLWSRPETTEPDLVGIPDDGKVVLYVHDDLVTLRDGRTGKKLRQFVLNDPRIWADTVRDGWVSATDCVLETHSGLVVTFAREGGAWTFLTGENLRQRLELGEHPASALRLAVIHGFELKAPWVASCRDAEDESVRTNAAAYAVARGQSWGRDILAPSSWYHRVTEEWDALLLGPHVGWGRVVAAGILVPFENQFLEKLSSPYGAGFAAWVLGQLHSRAAVPRLWSLVDATDPKEEWVAVEPLEALVLILGTEATAGLLARLEPHTHPDILGFLCRYFQRVPCREAVPALVEVLPTRAGAEARRALRYQARLDLGPEPQPWRDWLAAGRPRGQGLPLREPSALLWRERAGAHILATLAHHPRLVAVLSGSGELSFAGTNLLRLRGGPADPRGWDLTVPRELPGPGQPFLQSRDGRVLAVESTVSTAGAPPRALGGTVTALSQDGRWAVLDADRLVDLEGGVTYPLGEEFPIPRPDFDEHSRLLRATRSLDLTTSPPRRLKTEPPIALSPDATHALRLVTPHYGRGVGFLRSLSVSDPTFQTLAETAPQSMVKVSADGRQIAFVTPEGELGVVDWSGRRQKLERTPCDSIHCFRDQYLAIADGEALVLLRDLKPVHRIPLSEDVHVVELSPEARYLAAWTDDAIRVWELTPSGWTDGGDDTQLLTELWTGRRLQGGAAVWLTPDEYRDRVERWGGLWFEGVPSRPFPLRTLQTVLACVALFALGLLWTWTKRSTTTPSSGS